MTDARPQPDDERRRPVRHHDGERQDDRGQDRNQPDRRERQGDRERDHPDARLNERRLKLFFGERDLLLYGQPEVAR